MKGLRLRAINDTTAEIYCYGEVGQYEGATITAAAFLEVLRTAEQDRGIIMVRLHCVGGDPYEAFAILDHIESSRSLIHTINDGVTASAGTIILMGGQRRLSNKHGRIMTHQAAGTLQGSAKDFRLAADQLEKVNQQMSELYAEKTGKDLAYVTANWMKDGEDCWFTAEQAKAEGLIHEIAPSIVQAPSMAARSNFVKIAAHFDTALDAHTTEIFKTQNKPDDMKLVIAMLNGFTLQGKAINLKDDASEAEIVATLNKLKAEADANALAVKGHADALSAKDAEILKLKNEAETAKTEGLKVSAKAMVEAAETAGKITKLEVPGYLKLAEKDQDGYEAVKTILDAKKGFAGVQAHLNNGQQDGGQDPLLKLSYDEADKQGKLPELKAKHLEHFKALYKSRWNKEYKG